MNERDEPGPFTNGKPRAKYLTGKTPQNDVADAPAFTLTGSQLAALVKAAVDLAMDERDARQGAVTTEWLDRKGLARELGCSESKIDRLRQRGLPTEPFGDCPRFDLGAVRDWMRRQKPKS